MRNQQYRRNERQKALNRVLEWTSRRSYGWGHSSDLLVHSKKRSVNPASCSCWMCGNPRKYFGAVTRQEATWLDRARQELAEEGLRNSLPQRRTKW